MILKNFLVVSCFTIDTPYQKIIKNLRDSINKFKIPKYIKGYKSMGSWQKNVLYKASFILDCMEEFPNINIVFIDSDAIFKQYPELFEKIDCDFAVHTTNEKRSLFPNGQLLSGTIFLKNNNKSKELIKRWITESDKNPERRGQQSLQWVCENNSSDLNLKMINLPKEYCHVFSWKDNIDPVIEHFQASRNFKRFYKSTTYKINKITEEYYKHREGMI